MYTWLVLQFSAFWPDWYPRNPRYHRSYHHTSTLGELSEDGHTHVFDTFAMESGRMLHEVPWPRPARYIHD